MRNEAERTDVHGFAYGEGFSVHVQVDRLTGEILYESYNMSDSTGDHRTRYPHKPGRAKLPEIKAAVVKAIGEARERIEYKNVRRRDTEFSDLRFAFLVTWGRGGHSVYMDEDAQSSSTLQGYGLTPEEIAEIDRLGIPFVDTRTIPDDKILAVLSLPMWEQKLGKHDPAPWGGMSYAPVEVLAYMYRSLGATVRNITPRKPEAHELRNMHQWEKNALVGYTSGNEVMLMEAMIEARTDE